MQRGWKALQIISPTAASSTLFDSLSNAGLTGMVRALVMEINEEIIKKSVDAGIN